MSVKNSVVLGLISHVIMVFSFQVHALTLLIAEDIPVPSRIVHSLPVKPIGWADVPGDNGMGVHYETTTGGTGGTVLTASSGAELVKIFADIRTQQKKGKDPYIVKIKGTITSGSKMIVMKAIHNISVIGEGTDAKFKGTGLDLNMSSNIIVQNITFEDNPDDGVCLHYKETHHVWIDHCQFSDIPINSPPNRAVATSDDGNDGGLDIKRESSFVTVSNCRFENHSKTMLIGHSDGYTADKGHLKVTVHNNWFGYVYQRATRNRFGMVHLFNNYYRNTGSMLKMKPDKEIYQHGYAISSNCEANVVVENNYFHNVIWPTHVSRSLTDPVWIAFYGKTRNDKVHWGPTSAEPPGTITYRGTNIQNPPPGTELIFPEETYQIMKLDTTNPDPKNWNPWESYGYDAAKIAKILIDSKDVPLSVMRNAGPLTGDVSTGKQAHVIKADLAVPYFKVLLSKKTIEFQSNISVNLNRGTVYNIQGKSVWKRTFSGNKINRVIMPGAALSSGTYIARWYLKDGHIISSTFLF